MASKQEVAVVKEEQQDFSMIVSDAEEYSESLTKEDMTLPRLKLLQALSPEVQEGNSVYIDGARAGMFLNNITNELFDGKQRGVRFVSVYYHVDYNEWIPRSVGGGSFVTSHDATAYSQMRFTRKGSVDVIRDDSPIGNKGNEIIPTHSHFIFNIKDDLTYEPMILTLSSTHLKVSKKFNSLIAAKKVPGTVKSAPRFFGYWRALSRIEKNDKGSWYTYNFDDFGGPNGIFSLPNGKEIYESAKEFRNKIDSSITSLISSPANTTLIKNARIQEITDEVPF